ncbi:MAG TPA: TerB family tellurite resistance protein [Burkholderiaceae bacterium]|nr:TerB family tellurite resistance protein [Burkholderiaceae bacterium]
MSSRLNTAEADSLGAEIRKLRDMLKSIRDYFELNIGAQGAPSAERHSIELATAALLVEVVRSDADIQPGEQQAVLRAVREKFGLSAEEAETLMRLAEEEMRTANDYYQFTSLINRQFSQQQKQRVIELMWQVAYADAELSAHESHVLRRIAELLHVTHGDYIAAKMRARDAAERDS